MSRYELAYDLAEELRIQEGYQGREIVPGSISVSYRVAWFEDTQYHHKLVTLSWDDMIERL